jgi:hypothetical protein
MAPASRRSTGGTAMTETTTPKVGPATKLGADHAQALMPRAGILIGYARCSTEKQGLTAQRQILTELGVAKERVYLDHGLTGRNRSRPGLNNALAALREGDTLVVPKLDRLARSVPDARAIGDSLAARGVAGRGERAGRVSLRMRAAGV